MQLFNELISSLSLMACDLFSSYNIKDVSISMASVGYEISVVSILIWFTLVLIAGLSHKYDEGKWNNKCPRCAEKGIEVYVLPGKHCPRCNQPC